MTTSLPAVPPLRLSTLEAGCTGITAAWGRSLAEAASVCLESQGHSSPKTMNVIGSIQCQHAVEWIETDDQMRRCWADLDEAAEHGAYGVAALLIATHTDLEVVERSKKGTGFDYWLGAKGHDDLLFQRTARLEVSGIQRGDDSVRKTRVNKKLKQTIPTDGTLPAFVIVLEYGTPITQVANK